MPLKTKGHELRRRRQLQGMTLTEFAQKTGYTLSWASNVERGVVNAGPRYLRQAAEILDCEIADITVPDEPAVREQRASA